MKIKLRRQDRECECCQTEREALAQSRLDAEQSLTEATQRLADTRNLLIADLSELRSLVAGVSADMSKLTLGASGRARKTTESTESTK